jgi:hypothetical protein
MIKGPGLNDSRTRRRESFLVTLALLAGAAFLLKMCYLSLAFNTIFGVIFLVLVHLYLARRQGIRLPLTRLALAFAALQIDALGNYFRLYGHRFGPMQYDEFAHLTVQVLVTPALVWLTDKMLERRGSKLSSGLTAFLAATTIFSLSALYEIIELWDELYFHGQRIWTKYDTASDLQWDLLGILVGLLLERVLVGFRQSSLFWRNPELRRRQALRIQPRMNADQNKESEWGFVNGPLLF